MAALALSDLAEKLIIRSVQWDIHRSDELSGTGDARIWPAELADPLWTAPVSLTVGYHDELKRIAAIVRSLHGAQDTFMLYDPLSKFPQADPDGTLLGPAAVSVSSIGANNRSISLKGLPAGYVLTTGDKGQIVFSGGNFFFEFSRDVTASGTGVTPEVMIFPHCPPGLAINDPVTLAKPACEVFIMPGSHNPGRGEGVITSDAAFAVMERRR